MDNDCIDDGGTIWIWRLMGGDSDPARPSDPATRDLRWKLAEERLAQMEQEAASNIAMLRSRGRG
ncbi:MAG: hypothetical protein ACK4TC_18060 [Sphingomonas pseudosanguinis]|uniref:hypothetical protein n=1 Tax=Sphingomonas pseudosanguinis TaxID=413712 RepID=UPI00391C71C1